MKHPVQGHAVLAGLLAACLLVAHTSAETTLVEFGQDAQWRYQDDGKVPKRNWNAPDFDDSMWKSGSAPLGYGDPGLNTTVSFGPDPKKKHITVYFRHTFDVATAEGLEELVLLIRSDDGIIVYLNGNEIIRENLPEGSVQSTTTATRALGGLDERLYRRFAVPASALSLGHNVLAVEIHQADPRSTDLYLDLVLRAYAADEDPRPSLSSNAEQATIEYRTKHFIGPAMPIPDGYLDGGRSMVVAEDRSVQSGREIILVERERDRFLKRHLAVARSDGIRALPPVKRASLLATYVNYTMTLDGNGGSAQAAVSLMQNEYASKEVLLGEVPRICGAGVCRHQSLLFKLLAKEAGLDVALVRGNYSDGRTSGGHAWNELYLDDGRRVLFDVTLGHAETLVPDGSPISRRYLTVDNGPWYGKVNSSQDEGGEFQH